MRRKYLSVCLGLLCLMAACAQPTAAPPSPTMEEITTYAAETTASTTQGQEATTPVTQTPDTRLPPENWQDYPVVPDITGQAIETFRQGLAKGNNPNAFSKVGDCQSVKAAFMGLFDIPGRYILTENNLYLQETIDQFSGYFNTDGQAVKGGFNAAAVLSPMWANPEACLPGENPLECELRITKPIIAIISLEVWWEGRTPDRYETYMRRIIEYTMDHGVVPILATKADNVEGDHSINLATARLAYEYDIPLWNFWRAVQPLPNRGLDPERPDGFHISTEAWTVRSFTALETLDSTWRGLQSAAQANASILPDTTTSTPGTSVSPPQPPTIALTLEPGKNYLIFGLAQRQGEGYEYMGVFLYNLLDKAAVQLLGPGYNLQSVSPSGSQVLVNHGKALYRLDLGTGSSTLITDTFFSLGRTGATWISNDQIEVVIGHETGTAIVLFSPDGSKLATLPTTGTTPIEIYPSPDSTKMYWESGSCTSPNVCIYQGSYVILLEEELPQTLPDLTHPSLSPTGKVLAYTYISEENKSNLGFASPLGSQPRQYPLPGEILADYAWSPDGSLLAVVKSVRSDYSGRVSSLRTFLIDPITFGSNELPSTTGLSPLVLWSPDGIVLVLAGTNETEDGYAISLRLVDPLTEIVTDLSAGLNINSTSYLLITNLGWLQ